MTESQRISLRRSEVRQRLNELSAIAEPSDDEQKETDNLVAEFGTLERRYRAAVIAEGEDAEEREKAIETEEDAETRERRELREKARLSAYLDGYARGRLPSGVEAELAAAAGVEAGYIPLELWETGRETRDVTPAPNSGTGVNLQPIRPAVFAPAVLPRLGVDMPVVPSGTYAEGTITTSQTADAKAKGAAIEATAGAITAQTTTAHRIAARLEVALEDVATIGTANFEAMLRQNTALALSDELDDQGLNGDGSDANLTGLFQRLTDPNAPEATAAGFDDFLAGVIDSGIDGLWATRTAHLSIVMNPETYRLSAKTFRDISGKELGDISFADYAAEKFGGWWTNKRMPASASKVAQAIIYRMGRRLEGGSQSMRTAVCPVWARGIGIDDIYSGAAKGERYYTLSALVGDVIVVQPDAYKQIAYRVAA